MSNIYILGATGYVGHNLYEYMASKLTSNVYSTGRSNTDVYCNLETGEFNSLIERLKVEDIVVLLSSISSPDICERDYDLAYRVNVVNTIKLIKEILSVGAKVIFSSSDVVFGKAHGVCYENTERAPFGKYGEMKADVEACFENDHRVKIIRFSYILGSGDKFSNMISDFSKNKNVLDVYNGFERSVVSIRDVVEGISKIVQNWDVIDSNVINFSGPALVSRQRIVESLSLDIVPNLKFSFSDAPPDFWKGRPKTIEMKSIYLEALLGRPLDTLNTIIKLWS